VTHEEIGHDQAAALLPWLVNGTLQADERERVERHVRRCLPCRAELAEQRTLQRLVTRHPAVPVSAERDFERLLRRIDGGAAPRRERIPAWQRHALAAAAAIIGVGLAAVLWLAPLQDAQQGGAGYTALTDAGDSLHIDVIFADGTRETELRELLAELGAEIVAGPSPRLGRYTLRVVPGGPAAADIDAALQRLMSDARVRFAGRAYSPVVRGDGTAAPSGEAP
jgi:hypothetical protein